MKLTSYEKGSVVPGLIPMKAGEDMMLAEENGIVADLFDCGKYYQCPNVFNPHPGSGQFDSFLGNLKSKLDKPLVFASVINAGLYKYLYKHHIPLKDDYGRVTWLTMPANRLLTGKK